MSFIKYSDGSVKTISIDVDSEKAAELANSNKIEKIANTDIERKNVEESVVGDCNKTPKWAR